MEDKGRDSRLVAGARQIPRGASEPLKVAITIGDLGMCKRVIQQGADLEAGYQDCNGCTPLLYSLRLRQPLIAEYLALQGAAPAGKVCCDFNLSGYSAFHLATQFNYSTLLQILLERHSNQYLHLTDAIHPFHFAIVSQATECVSLMINHAGKGMSSSKAHKLSMRLIAPIEGTSTSAASRQRAKTCAGQLTNLRVGILDGSLTQEGAKSNDTPLILAAVAKNHEIARLLMETGSLIDEGGLTHKNPLHHAALGGDREMVEILLEFGANPQVQDSYLRTPAMFAAKGGNLQALQALSRGGADLQALDQYGMNALHYAVWGSWTEIFLYLMATMTEYDLAQKSIIGESILGAVFNNGDHNLLTLVLNIAPISGAYCPSEFNVLTNAVQNPSMTAGAMRMLLRKIPQELLPTLLTYRAHFGGTPLYTACTRTNMPLQSTMINQLLDTGADLETEGGDHGTPLMGACAAGRLLAVKLLVRKGAKVLYCNEHGRSFSALRAAKHFPEIVRWLLVGRCMEGPGLLTNSGI